MTDPLHCIINTLTYRIEKDRIIKHLTGIVSSLRKGEQEMTKELERKEEAIKKQQTKAENKMKKLQEEVNIIILEDYYNCH